MTTAVRPPRHLPVVSRDDLFRFVPSAAPVVFRDPGSREPEMLAHKLAIASLLVRANELPVKLPAVGFNLLDLDVDGKAITLVFGMESPMARVRLERPARDATSAVPSFSTQELVPSAERLRPALAAITERLARSITAEKWSAAWERARPWREIPRDVPLHFYRQIVEGADQATALVRTGFNCNQDCGICWQGRDWGRHDADQVRTWIEDLAQSGARELVISGGEPTLDPHLASYIRLARTLGFETVVIETNAIQLGKPGAVEALREAGLTHAFVSLHSPDGPTSDAITRAPGTHARTVAGIGALLNGGIHVRVNAVTTGEGLAHFAQLPDFVHANFGNHPQLDCLVISYPTDPFDRALQKAILPEPVQLRAVLRHAVVRARELGIRVEGLDGPCGPQLCASGADPRDVRTDRTVDKVTFRVHLPACDACAVKHACFGVRQADVDLYGESVVAPVALPGDQTASTRTDGNALESLAKSS